MDDGVQVRAKGRDPNRKSKKISTKMPTCRVRVRVRVRVREDQHQDTDLCYEEGQRA